MGKKSSERCMVKDRVVPFSSSRNGVVTCSRATWTETPQPWKWLAVRERISTWPVPSSAYQPQSCKSFTRTEIGRISRPAFTDIWLRPHHDSETAQFRSTQAPSPLWEVSHHLRPVGSPPHQTPLTKISRRASLRPHPNYCNTRTHARTPKPNSLVFNRLRAIHQKITPPKKRVTRGTCKIK